jgi:hypothetical protein
MAYPPITPLPAAPSRNDPENFSTEADAWVAALPALVTETNAAGVYTADQATAAAADAVLTAADVVSTNADVVSTGDDVTAATAQVALAADEVALATTQANNAAGSATTALGYLDAFEDSYIGQYADDTAADASGKTIVDGVFYFKTTATAGLRIYNGSAWSAAVLDTAGALMAANDLSDVASASTALVNIGGAPQIDTYTKTEVNNTIGALVIDPTLATFTQSMVADQEKVLSLSRAVTIPVVSVTKDVVQSTATENNWVVDADGQDYSAKNYAPSTTATPSGTTGSITISLGSGTFSGYEGYSVKGNGGIAVIKNSSGTAEVLVDFDSTATIDQGSWELVKVIGVNGVMSLSGYSIFDAASPSISTPIVSYSDTTALASVALSNGNVFVAYRLSTGAANYKVYNGATFGEVKGATLLTSTSVSDLTCSELSNGNVVVSYSSSGGKFHIFDNVGTQVVSKTSFSSSVQQPFVAASTTGNFTIAFIDSSNNGSYVVYNNSGTGIVSQTNFLASRIERPALIPMNNGNIVFVFQDYNNSSRGRYLIKTSSGGAASGSGFLSSLNTDNMTGAPLENGGFMIGYKENANGNGKGYLRTYDSSGSLVNGPIIFENNTVDAMSATALSNGSVLFAYRDGTAPNGGEFTVCSAAGAVLNSAQSFSSGDTTIVNASTSSSGDVFISFRDTDQSGYAKLARLDLVDTQFLSSDYAVTLTNSVGQVDSQFWEDIESMSVTDTLNSQSAFYATSSDDSTTWKIADDSLGIRTIARDNAGTWEFNSDATYGSSTFTSATINTAYDAISEAMAVAVNQMSAVQLGAVQDANHFPVGDTFDFAIILHSNTDQATPTSNGATVDYKGLTKNQSAIVGTDYLWSTQNTSTVVITALLNNNLRGRIV